MNYTSNDKDRKHLRGDKRERGKNVRFEAIGCVVGARRMCSGVRECVKELFLNITFQISMDIVNLTHPKLFNQRWAALLKHSGRGATVLIVSFRML